MEGRNVIIAIALSLSVILFWEAFMTVPKKELQNNSTSQSKQFKEENDNNKDDSIAPSINEIKIPKSVSRNESIDSVQRIKINNENFELIAGSLIEVTVNFNIRSSLGIPDTSLMLEGNKAYVYKVSEDNIANKIEIEIGIRNNGFVEVLSGLSEGDIIVSEGLKKVRAKAKIKPIKK